MKGVITLTEKELKRLNQIAQGVVEFLREWGIDGTIAVEAPPHGKRTLFWGFGKWEHPDALLMFNGKNGERIEVGAYAGRKVRVHCGNFVEKSLWGKQCKNVRENKILSLPFEFFAAVEVFLILLLHSGLADAVYRCSPNEVFSVEIKGTSPNLRLRLEVMTPSDAKLFLNQSQVIMEGDVSSVLKQVRKILALSAF